MIPEILATLASGIFAGAAIYINLVEQPARLSCGITLALREWRPSYKRGAAMQASLALLGSALGFVSWWKSGDPAWIIGGALLFAVIPVTLIVILPTNKRLQNDKLDMVPTEAERLLRLWGKLHAVRSALSLIAFLIFLFAMRHAQ